MERWRPRRSAHSSASACSQRGHSRSENAIQVPCKSQRVAHPLGILAKRLAGPAPCHWVRESTELEAGESREPRILGRKRPCYTRRLHFRSNTSGTVQDLTGRTPRTHQGGYLKPAGGESIIGFECNRGARSWRGHLKILILTPTWLIP
jgi:hypothetical protein